MRYALVLFAALGGATFVTGLVPFANPLQSSKGDDGSSRARENVVPVVKVAERPHQAKQERANARNRRVPRRTAGKRGELRIVPGRSDVVGEGPLVRFVVEVEGRVSADTAAFTLTVERALANPRGWGATRSFQRVDSEPFDLRVALASPSLTDRLCSPLQTNGIFSCADGHRAVLNLRRWRRGAEAYGNDVARYRIYMINHEIGHVLGLGHATCAESAAKAPVMMQQTKGVAPCVANPWPLAWEKP